jgi:hypothetical protein
MNILKYILFPLAGFIGYSLAKEKVASASTMKTPIPPEISSQNISQMGISPSGYKPASTVPSNISSKCVELLNQPYGYEEYITGSNGIEYFIRVEPHYWYGADSSKPNKWHKGSTVYVKV